LSHLFFSGEVLSRACSEALARCTGIAHCQGQRTLRGNNRDTCVWAAAVLAFRSRGQQCRRVCCCVVEALGMGYFLHASCGPIRPSRNPPCTQLLRRSAMLSGSVPVARNGPAEFLVCRHLGPALQADLLLCGGFGNGLLLHSSDRFAHPAILHARSYCAAVQC